MSRLTDLLHKARQSDPALAADLEREIKHLTERRAFGLNFERHTPETVELPGRKVRRGDKVRLLPPRGQARKAEHDTLWRVTAISSDGDSRVAELGLLAGERSESANVDDLVVVAEFRDPIYPGLVSTGKVERGGDKPFHTVINAENYHALQTLLFTHRGKIDAIYIDPPYNTGAKDWKYNNDYVDGDDHYRHSKWLAFMERRLELARGLLNPENSVLVVTIDEKEYLRLGLLLEQLFPSAEIQMVTSVIAPQGSARGRFFKRSEEYIFCVYFGDAAVLPLPLGSEWGGAATTVRGSIHWASLKRTGTGARRSDREGMFYPVFLDKSARRFVAVGEPLGVGVQRASLAVPEGCIAIWPLRRDGSEGRWQVGPTSLRTLVASGYARLGQPKGEDTAIAYLKSGEQKKVGLDYQIAGRRYDGSIITEEGHETEAAFRPSTVWNLARHSAGHHGSNVLRNLLPGRSFPFPKSLYAVEDTLRFFVANKPSAVILDFFAGSGTTAHAVMRLNNQDGGSRQCISVTNNEVSGDEQSGLRNRGLRPGDPEWEQRGICDHITKPRVLAAITGRTLEDLPIKGKYTFTDEFPMADGFEENAEFFTLTYESPGRVARNRDFAQIASLLWLASGSVGRRIEDLPTGWDVADSYGVLVDLDQSRDFVHAVAQSRSVTHAFIVTDDERSYQALAASLPDHVESVRLYEAYLKNFEIQTARSAQ